MISQRPADCGELYHRKRHELIELARTLTPDQLHTRVPATPAWSVHDAISHVVGLTADLNALRFPRDGNSDTWTAAQVESRRDRTVEQLGAEWDHEGPTFEKGLRLLGYEFGSHYLGDLLHHIADIHVALRLGPIADDEALAVGLDFYLDSTHQALGRADVGAIEVICEPERWRLGSGQVIATLTAGRYDLFRTLGGRRGHVQIRAMTWTGRIDAVILHLSRYPLPVTTVDI